MVVGETETLPVVPLDGAQEPAVHVVVVLTFGPDCTFVVPFVFWVTVQFPDVLQAPCTTFGWF